MKNDFNFKLIEWVKSCKIQYATLPIQRSTVSHLNALVHCVTIAVAGVDD